MTPDEVDDAWLDAVAVIKARLTSDEEALKIVWQNTPNQLALLDGTATIAALSLQAAATAMRQPPDQLLEQLRRQALGDDAEG